MLRITDKSFRYTPSHETDLGKKFRKMERDRRQAEAANLTSEAADPGASIVPLDLRRNAQKTK